MEAVQESLKTKSNILFGELLVSKGLLNHTELTKAINEQRKDGGRLGEVLLRLKILSDEDVTSSLAEYLSMEYLRFDDITGIDVSITRILPESIAKRFCLVAIVEADDKIIIAMADPLNVIAIDTITLKLKRRIKVVVSSHLDIRRAIEASHTRKAMVDCFKAV